MMNRENITINICERTGRNIKAALKNKGYFIDGESRFKNYKKGNLTSCFLADAFTKHQCKYFELDARKEDCRWLSSDEACLHAEENGL
jgi:hypothetical protein